MSIPRILLAALVALTAGVVVEIVRDKPSPAAAPGMAKLAVASR